MARMVAERSGQVPRLEPPPSVIPAPTAPSRAAFVLLVVVGLVAAAVAVWIALRA